MLLVLPIIWELGELTRLKNRLMEIFKESEALNDGKFKLTQTYSKKNF